MLVFSLPFKLILIYIFFFLLPKVTFYNGGVFKGVLLPPSQTCEWAGWFLPLLTVFFFLLFLLFIIIFHYTDI